MSERPDMVVPSIDGDRWSELGKRLTPAQRDEAVDALCAALDRWAARHGAVIDKEETDE